MRTPQSLLFFKLNKPNCINLSSKNRCACLWLFSGPAPTALHLSHAEDSRFGHSTLNGASEGQTGEGQLRPSPCWPPLLWCHTGYCWLSGLEEHTIGSHLAFHQSGSPRLLSMSISPSLYTYLGLRWPKHKVLHLVLLNIIRKTRAHFSSLSIVLLNHSSWCHPNLLSSVLHCYRHGLYHYS